MRISLNTSKWHDHLWAALLFFTRLPLWRLRQPPREAYRHIVCWWPLTGWLTAAITAAILYFGAWLLPYYIVVIIAVAARMLLTGALHEDGLADTFDGFGGGGHDRSRILAIMKDSRIGTYGVIALIIYFLLLTATLYSLGAKTASLAVLAADPFSKLIAGQLTLILPYARSEQEAKSGITYTRPGTPQALAMFLCGTLPAVPLLLTGIRYELLLFVPCATFYALYLFIRRRLGSYTGDCCGATQLTVELSLLLTIAALT